MKPSIIFSSLLIIFLIFTATATISGYTFKAITPNFSATYLEFIDDSGTFLISPNGTFKAAIFNPGSQQTSFYLCIIHVASRTITWSANRGRAVSSSGQMNLTVKGITISDESGRNNPVWSTPPLRSQVGRLVLTDMGNLLLLDPSNVSLWESFRYPTDTIIIGQSLPVGSSLSSSSSDSDLSIGSYNLTITSSDAILQWLGQTYWKLSMDTKAYRNSLSMVEYMAVNRTGFYLFGSNGTVAVFLVGLPESNFRVATLDNSGHFVIKSFSSGTGWKQEFQGPDDGCGTPLVCGRVGLCNDDDTSSSSSSSSSSSLPVCSCPQNFHVGSGNSGGCVPSNGSYSFPYSCDGSNNDSYHNNNQSNSSSSVVSFLNLGNGLDYFHNIYTDPVMDSVDLSLCQDQCSKNCSCLGVFYRNSSGSCYVIENELGSILSSNDGANQDMFGFIKVSIGSTTTNDDTRDVEDGGGGFPVVAAVLLPITGFALLMAFLFFLWRRSIKISKRKQDLELGKPNNNYSHSSGDLDAFYIPGGGGGHNSSSSSTSGLLYFPLLALEKHEEGNYMDLADPRLEGRVTNEEVEKLVRIALCCVHEEPALRPNMAAVVGMLEGGMPLPQPKMESLNFLRFYGRRFTEASMIIEENNDNEGGRREVNNNSSSSMTSGGSQAALVSYISSQTVSGPR
ncbi:hypothetical protein Ahy_A07g033642 [Arachis hypogaea]|uniref:Bulb-type lectin domain-containing protein n=1 Tax=Arachis hypogaea TaxID=3818 RepID=A0A445C9S5_ARAHY|nr:hypothetical protein Ahy_A07g033642 [Arachis hypogaea]